MIKINVEKVVLGNGAKMIKLVGFTGLSREDSPILYYNNMKETTTFNNDHKSIYFIAHALPINFWVIGTSISEKTFEKIMTHIKKSGNNLMAVNAHLAELRKSWHGTKTYKI